VLCASPAFVATIFNVLHEIRRESLDNLPHHSTHTCISDNCHILPCIVVLRAELIGDVLFKFFNHPLPPVPSRPHDSLSKIVLALPEIIYHEFRVPCKSLWLQVLTHVEYQTIRH